MILQIVLSRDIIFLMSLNLNFDSHLVCSVSEVSDNTCYHGSHHSSTTTTIKHKTSVPISSKGIKQTPPISPTSTNGKDEDISPLLINHTLSPTNLFCLKWTTSNIPLHFLLNKLTKFYNLLQHI